MIAAAAAVVNGVSMGVWNSRNALAACNRGVGLRGGSQVVSSAVPDFPRCRTPAMRFHDGVGLYPRTPTRFGAAMSDQPVFVAPYVASHLVVDDAAAAIDFYVKAFGAEEMGRLAGPDGKIVHAALVVNGAMVMLNDDFPEMSGGKSMTPTSLGGSGVTIHLQFVDDVDVRFQRALDAGATVVAPLEEQFWGDRYGAIRDPFGHFWSLAQQVREVSMEELAEKMQGS